MSSFHLSHFMSLFVSASLSESLYYFCSLLSDCLPFFSLPQFNSSFFLNRALFLSFSASKSLCLFCVPLSSICLSFSTFTLNMFFSLSVSLTFSLSFCFLLPPISFSSVSKGLRDFSFKRYRYSLEKKKGCYKSLGHSWIYYLILVNNNVIKIDLF